LLYLNISLQMCFYSNSTITNLITQTSKGSYNLLGWAILPQKYIICIKWEGS